jgi:hypothetical protein
MQGERNGKCEAFYKNKYLLEVITDNGVISSQAYEGDRICRKLCRKEKENIEKNLWS